MSKYKIGDQVELNHELNYEIVMIEGFDFNDEKNVEIAYSKDFWFYFHQIRKIIKKGSK
tara:strand:- start:454 stop:630 length:177 start_codon:yes stop_codon:yes gene_type:complete